MEHECNVHRVTQSTNFGPDGVTSVNKDVINFAEYLFMSPTIK